MKITVNSLQDTFTKLYELLDTHKKVYYCRFGDGDINIMSGNGRCIEHAASPELQKELVESFTIEDSNYLRGVMVKEPIFDGHQLRTRNNSPDEMIAINLLTYIAVEQQELMVDFLDRFIRPKKKLFIGSVEKNAMERLVGKIDYYVKIPVAEVNEQTIFPGAYYFIDEWWPKVLDVIDDVELVLPSAGMAGRVITKRLWNLDKDIHSIELGSMVDAVVGKMSRSIWAKNNNDEKIRNLLKEF